MLQTPFLRSAARAGAAVLVVLPAPLAAQQPDTTARDSVEGVQIITPEDGRRRAEAAGTAIAGERPEVPLSFRRDSYAPARLDDFMSPREMEETGVARLTPEEQAALVAWLQRYRSMRALAAAPRRFAPRAPAVRVEVAEAGDPRLALRITDKSGGGTMLMLADGTMWEVYLPDRPMTDAWPVGQAVRVREAAVAVDGYDYELLVGGDDDERALVKFVGLSSRRRSGTR